MGSMLHLNHEVNLASEQSILKHNEDENRELSIAVILVLTHCIIALSCAV